jgi:hypothetical protein
MEDIHDVAMEAWKASKGGPKEREQEYYEAVAAFTAKLHLPEDDVSEGAKERYNEKFAKFVPSSEYEGEDNDLESIKTKHRNTGNLLQKALQQNRPGVGILNQKVHRLFEKIYKLKKGNIDPDDYF